MPTHRYLLSADMAVTRASVRGILKYKQNIIRKGYLNYYVWLVDTRHSSGPFKTRLLKFAVLRHFEVLGDNACEVILSF